VLIALGEYRLAQLPVARDARVALIAEYTATLETLQAGVDQLFIPRIFRDEIRRLHLSGDIMPADNERALRALIEQVRTANMDDINGPRLNSNTEMAWRRRFVELTPQLPDPGFTEQYRQAVAALIQRIQDAREGKLRLA
jgi:hypothetical protein